MQQIKQQYPCYDITVSVFMSWATESHDFNLCLKLFKDSTQAISAWSSFQWQRHRLGKLFSLMCKLLSLREKIWFCWRAQHTSGSTLWEDFIYVGWSYVVEGTISHLAAILFSLHIKPNNVTMGMKCRGWIQEVYIHYSTKTGIWLNQQFLEASDIKGRPLIHTPGMRKMIIEGLKDMER